MPIITVTIDTDKVKVVPIMPTAEMINAAHRAIMEHNSSLPEDVRSKSKGRPRGIYIKAQKKHVLRYQAMLSAAPDVGEDVG